jgi:hypothetical protein
MPLTLLISSLRASIADYIGELVLIGLVMVSAGVSDDI